jgi:phospholipase C
MQTTRFTTARTSPSRSFLSGILLLLAAPAFGSVTISSPQPGAAVSSPVSYVATANGGACASGVSAMGIYVNNSLVYQVNGGSIDTTLTLNPGSYYTVVQEWDNCGGASSTPVSITVPGAGGTGGGSTQNGVTISSPANNSTVSSPVMFSATAGSTTCASGVAAMGIYANQTLVYQANGSSINTPLNLKPGMYAAVVQEWDNCGGSLSTPVDITIPGGSTQNGVSVSSPANYSTVSSPVAFAATAGSTSCFGGIAAMGIYVNGSLAYKTNGASINTQLPLKPGMYATVVQEWDYCGGSLSTPVNITVPGGSMQNGVSVSSPANYSTVGSPVTYAATAGSTSCFGGIAAMGIYVNGSLAYKTSGASINTALTLSPGMYATVVQAWDNCGGAVSTPVNITIPGGSTQNGVTISSPTNNSTDGSPVAFSATAGSTSCFGGIAAMGIYANGSLAYKTNGASISTPLTLTPGSYGAVVVAWDNCGSALSTPVNFVVPSPTPPTISVTATSSTITSGSTATLHATADNASQVSVTGSDGSTYTLPATGGPLVVAPTATTTYTVTATGTYGNSSATTTVTVVSVSDLQKIQHVVFMLQENHSFDNYFGMLNPYRQSNGWNVGQDGKVYTVDGIDDKLTSIVNLNDEGIAYAPFKLKSTCIDDASSSWLESYGNVNRYDFGINRSTPMDGFVHTAEARAKTCSATGGYSCAGTFTDLNGQRAMGYYDQGFLNYYYYMASQFAVSDRWFSPLSSMSIPNRIATFTGGTTQGLVFDPGGNDHLPQLNIPSIFQKLTTANVSWKIYYTVTQGSCLAADDCQGGASAQYPATDFSYLADSLQYLYENPTGATCTGTTQPSSVVGDLSNSFCVDPNHIAPLSTYYTDVANGTPPSFSFIEAGYGHNDEHPGSGQSVITGQAEVANVINALTTSPSWSSTAFFLSYDEGGGPYDHVPPVQGTSNLNTNSSLGPIPDISQIAVNADQYNPCVPSGGITTTHCDLNSNNPGASPGDAAAQQGFAAQLGFRVPNIVISPFTRQHYVSHTPMDHTAIIKFVENRFIGPSAHLTQRDASQPDLLDFFDFTGVPWATPPTPPAPVTPQTLGYDPCTPTKM